MQFLRRLTVHLAASLLVVVLLSFGLSWSVQQVFGTSKNIKHALAASGIYHSIVAETLDRQQSDQSTLNTGSDNVPTNQPEIRKIISDAFPPAFLQTQSEQVIDATYSWLNGKTPGLQFSIDLSGAKARLADGLGQYAGARLASLPTCTADNIPTGDIDPFNATCLPPGVDTAALAAKARDNILNGDFLKNPVIRANTIKNDNGDTLDQQLHAAPQAYRKVGQGVASGAVLIVLLSIVVVFLSATWRVGVRKLATISVTIGVISVSLGLLSSFALHQASRKLAELNTSDKALQQQLMAVVQSLADNLRNWWVTYGLVLAVLGIGALLALRFTSPKIPANAAGRIASKDEPEPVAATSAIPLLPPKNPKHKTNE